jgi:hypothetical protein
MVWGWALWTALLLSVVTAGAVLAPPAPAPLVGAAAVEGAVRRLSYGTARLLESFGAGDATTATVRRAQLLADADTAAGALTARSVAARRTVAGLWSSSASIRRPLTGGVGWIVGGCPQPDRRGSPDGVAPDGRAQLGVAARGVALPRGDGDPYRARAGPVGAPRAVASGLSRIGVAIYRRDALDVG